MSRSRLKTVGPARGAASRGDGRRFRSSEANRRKPLLSVLGLLASGCITSSGVVLPYGPDTYTISTSAYDNAASRAAAIKRANEYCGEQGRVMMPESELTKRSQVGEWGLPGTDFTFMCLESGDARLEPPRRRPTPDIVIEDKR